MNGEINWNAKEYNHNKKSNDWYWALGIIATSLTIASIIYQNYLFALFIILATAILIMYAFRHPEEFSITIGPKGIKIKNDLFKYKDLKSFYLDTSNEHGPKLIIHSNRTLMPHIILPIDKNLEIEIKTKLLTHLKEEEMHEPISHKLMEYLGF